MFAAISRFFGMLSMFFMAGEKFASSINNVAEWADESTGAFTETARAERAQKLAIHKAKMDLIKGTAGAIAKTQLDQEQKLAIAAITDESKTIQ